jgi:hypothetical protein
MTFDGSFFSICGVPKAGTTSLHHYLDAHPQICMSDPKETDFFQHNYDKGWEYFDECFDPSPEARMFGETSPGNMIHPKAPRRIAHHFPDARLFFVLRNPIERAYSQYLYGIMRGTNSPTESFSELIRNQDNPWGRRILELGLYYEQLARFERYFPRNQMWVGLFQDFKENNQAFVRRMLEFLELDTSTSIEIEDQHNTTRYPRSKVLLRMSYSMWEPVEAVLTETALSQLKGLRSRVRNLLFQEGEQEKPAMKSADREYLRNYYAEPNCRLEEWLGQDLSHWM